MGKLDAKIQKLGTKLDLTLAGTIDEDTDFSKIPLLGSAEIELHLSGLKSINSCGIREWIKWMASAQNAKLVLHECPKVIVDQINMVNGFIPTTAKIQSFFVPYYNDDSGSEKEILFRFGTEFSENGVNPPESVKDVDGNEMEMDVIEAKYFKFIKK